MMYLERIVDEEIEKARILREVVGEPIDEIEAARIFYCEYTNHPEDEGIAYSALYDYLWHRQEDLANE